eukprot:SM000171S03219  [mRNA]  locus=s171:79041:85456:- [translate_table: standard]
MPLNRYAAGAFPPFSRFAPSTLERRKPLAATAMASIRASAALALAILTQAVLLGAAQANGGGKHFYYWNDAHATFYGGADASGTMGGACGYGNLYSSGYGTDTAAASSALFNDGMSCGQCYQLQCVGSSACKPGMITVTVTNLCPNDFSKPSDAGGWCNYPRQHFDLSQPAYQKIGVYGAGIVPIQYRRVPCLRTGDIMFSMGGNPFYLDVTIKNVGGSGDLSAVWVKGNSGQWRQLSQNWGMQWSADIAVQGQALSFRLQSQTTGQILTVENAVPSSWSPGSTYQAGQFPPVSMKPRGGKHKKP